MVMVMGKAALILIAVGLALFVGAAHAGTIQDLAGLGYTVSIANPGPEGQNCPTYVISGHGVQTYMNCQTPQADIDSLANPARICNADWQLNHPDQLQALDSIRSQGWSVTGDQCADLYTVSNPNDGTVKYSGAGAGLVPLAGIVGAPPVTNGAVAPAPADPNAGQCLPLCATPPTTKTTTTTATGGANGATAPTTSSDGSASVPAPAPVSGRSIQATAI